MFETTHIKQEVCSRAKQQGKKTKQHLYPEKQNDFFSPLDFLNCIVIIVLWGY